MFSSFGGQSRFITGQHHLVPFKLCVCPLCSEKLQRIPQIFEIKHFQAKISSYNTKKLLFVFCSFVSIMNICDSNTSDLSEYDYTLFALDVMHKYYLWIGLSLNLDISHELMMWPVTQCLWPTHSHCCALSPPSICLTILLWNFPLKLQPKEMPV